MLAIILAKVRQKCLGRKVFLTEKQTLSTMSPGSSIARFRSRAARRNFLRVSASCLLPGERLLPSLSICAKSDETSGSVVSAMANGKPDGRYESRRSMLYISKSTKFRAAREQRWNAVFEVGM